MNKMRRVLLLFFIITLISAGSSSCALSAIASLPQRSTQSAADLSQVSADLSEAIAAQNTASTAAANAQSTFVAREAALSTAIAEAQTTSTAQESLLQDANHALSTATQVASSNSTQIADLRHLSATQYLQIEDYNNSIRCSARPDSIDFSNNTTVSASIKSWLEDTSESISKAKWEVLWEGTETAIHMLDGEQYYYVFIVYFDEPENYFYSSVYDIYGHCFIYP